MPIAIQIQPSPRVQEVSSAIQIQGKKLAGWEDAIQTQTAIQLQIQIVQISQWQIIMKLNISFQDEDRRASAEITK